MPAKNTLKIYVEGGYYHIYNRGVDKRRIFEDPQDYQVFLDYLGDYLQPRDEQALMKRLAVTRITPREREKILRRMQLNNFSGEISLLAYCLMPNHFHILVKQTRAESIDKLMRSFGTRYVMYFNRKHRRIGPLFQGVYKAALIEDEAHYAHITRYIHKQALGEESGDERAVQPSSFPEYLGTRRTAWVQAEEILALFPGERPREDYARFVAEYRPTRMDTRLFFDEE